MNMLTVLCSLQGSKFGVLSLPSLSFLLSLFAICDESPCVSSVDKTP